MRGNGTFVFIKRPKWPLFRNRYLYLRRAGKWYLRLRILGQLNQTGAVGGMEYKMRANKRNRRHIRVQSKSVPFGGVIDAVLRGTETGEQGDGRELDRGPGDGKSRDRKRRRG